MNESPNSYLRRWLRARQRETAGLSLSYNGVNTRCGGSEKSTVYTSIEDRIGAAAPEWRK